MTRIFISLFSVLTALVALAADHSLVILHTNDTHSQIDPDFDGKGGVLRRKVLIDSIRACHDNVLLVDAGDAVQGTLYFNLFKGEVEVALLDSLGYDYVTLGNHEFDNGLASMEPYYSRMKARLLASGYDLSRSPLRNIATPCEVRNFAGRNIAFISANVDPYGLILPENFNNIECIKPLPYLDNLAGMLKCSMGVDYVVVLSHLGYRARAGKDSDVALAEGSRNIDVIIGGHSHTVINSAKTSPMVKNLDGKDVLVAQTGSLGKNLGVITINLDDLTASSALIEVNKRLDSRTSPTLATYLAPFKAQVDEMMNRTIATSAEPLANRGTGLLNHWNADASLKLLSNFYDGKVDLAIMNRRGVRRPMPQGDVSEGLILSMFPFENFLTVLEMTGAQLKESFRVLAKMGDNSVSRGVVIRYNRATDQLNATINGKPIDDSKKYRVLTLDYLAKGGDNQDVMRDVPRLAVDNVKYGERMLPYVRSLGDKGTPIVADPTPRLIVE